MAEVLPQEGKVFTLESNSERVSKAKSFFYQSPHGSKIEIIQGTARESLETFLDGSIDLMLIKGIIGATMRNL